MRMLYGPRPVAAKRISPEAVWPEYGMTVDELHDEIRRLREELKSLRERIKTLVEPDDIGGDPTA